MAVDTKDIIAPEEDGEIERYGAYTRLNPSGHREQVVKRKGKTPEETLNELADTLMQLLESSPETSMPSGKCWYCDKPKDNIYGLCVNCGRFGKPDNQQSQTGNTGQVPWEGPDPTIGAQRIFTPHSPGMSSEQDYIRRQNNLKHGFDEPIEPFQLRESVQINPSPYNGIVFFGEPQDDTEQLVAYRARFTHNRNKVLNSWMVFHKGVHFANISRQDTKWVHDNWKTSYVPGAQEIFKQIDRTFLDKKLREMISLIRRAISAKRADVVVLPTKEATPEKLDDSFRTWTNKAGTAKIQAQYVKFVGDKVVVRRADGREIHMPFDMLSDADQEEALRLADTDTLTECVEEYIWNRVFQLLPEELHNWPGINDLVDQMIGDGKGPDEIADAVNKAYWDE